MNPVTSIMAAIVAMIGPSVANSSIAVSPLTLSGASIGMNSVTIENWTFSAAFSNLMLRMAPWRPYAGNVGTMTMSGQGLLASSNATDRYFTAIDDTSTLGGSGQPNGTYTVLNPDGLNIAIGRTISSYDWAGWTTSSEFTFEYTGGPIVLHAQGSVTANSGALAVIIPNHRASWLSGNPFNQAFITFMSSLSLKTLRTMDWTRTMDNFAIDWAHRTRPPGVGRIGLYNEYIGTGKPAIPWEYICRFSTLTNIPAWICVPVRSNQDYLNQLAALFKAQYPTTLRLAVEYGNEIWNWAQSFMDGTSWVRYLKHTRIRSPIASATGIVQETAHGMTTGQQIVCFRDPCELGLSSAPADPLWVATGGATAEVVVVDADSFRIRKPSNQAVLDFTNYKKSHLLYIKVNEAGKSENMHGHYAEQLLKIWDAFDAELGANRIEHIVAGQAGDTTIASSRLAAPGISARADAVAIAPYFTGRWMGAKIDIASGSVTPSFWTQTGLSQASSSLVVRLYLGAENPDTAAVIAGTGAIAGYGPQVFAPTGNENWTALTTLSSLTPATSYKLIIAVQMDGAWWRLEHVFTPSAVSTVFVTDTFVNQKKRASTSILQMKGFVVANQALGKPVIFYECGNHNDENAPAELSTWRQAYIDSVQYAELIKLYLTTMADTGVKLACWFSDIARQATPQVVWSVSERYSDLTTKRYLEMASFGGFIASPSAENIADLSGLDMQTRPANTDQAIVTLPSNLYNFEIYAGNESGAYRLSAGRLTIADLNKIDWTAPKANSIKLLGRIGQVLKMITISFTTGSAWYQADALFAWTPIGSSTQETLTPVVGGPLAKTVGSTATAVLSGDLLDMNNCAYFGESMTANLKPSREMLIAVVLDKDDQTAAYSTIAKFGGGQNFRFEVNANVSTDFRLIWSLSTGNGSLTFPTATGKNVFWLYSNGVDTITIGVNQVNGATNSTVGLAAAVDFGKTVNIGSTGNTPASKMKHGSALVINRFGLTLEQAKAAVAKLQTHHGI